jgi:hypothetical protein
LLITGICLGSAAGVWARANSILSPGNPAARSFAGGTERNRAEGANPLTATILFSGAGQQLCTELTSTPSDLPEERALRGVLRIANDPLLSGIEQRIKDGARLRRIVEALCENG